MAGSEQWELNKTESAHTEHTLMEASELAASNYTATHTVLWKNVSESSIVLI